MSVRDGRRTGLLERMSDHVLAHGLAAASLRPLAAAAGTSDRMLLYYFADKDALLAALLGHVAARLAALLQAGRPDTAALPYRELLAELAAAVRAPALLPYMRLWLDLAATAGRGVEPHRAIAGGIADGFLAWIAARLQEPDPARRAAQAATLLTVIEGVALLDALGRGAVADVALAAARDRAC